MGAHEDGTADLWPDVIKTPVTRRDMLRSVGAVAMASALPPLRLFAAPLRTQPAAGLAPGATPCLTRSKPTFPPPLQRFIDKLDPASDVFPIEVYVVELERQFAGLSAALTQTGSSDKTLDAMIHDRLVFTPFEAGQVIPLRSGKPLESERHVYALPTASGRTKFVTGWSHAMAGFAPLHRAEFEIFAVRTLSELPLVIETDIAYDLLGREANGTREQRTGTWTIRWRRSAAETWLADRWAILPETRVHLSGPAFTEMTAQVLDPSTAVGAQLGAGIDHWRTVLDAAIGLDVYGNHGIAAGDIDASGRDSLYICQPSGLPNRLLRNRGDGTFEDITDASGTGLLDGTASALFVDFQNRGRQDLLVVRSGGPLLFENMGEGRFEPSPEAFRFARPAQGTFTSVAVADYNRDGLLDVYFCLYSYYQGLDRYQFPSPYYDAKNGPPNFLFRNNGDGTFEDVTVSSGMDMNNDRFSFAVEWCDYDDDGWPDLYVANDFGRKNLYRNHRDGTFTDVAGAAGVEDYGPGMSTCWLDYDGDGRQDLYVANMWLREGRRITADNHFLPAVPEPVRALYRKHNAGNSMYRNRGDGTFADATVAAGTARCGWSWSCASWDFDHDGWADLYVANGFVSGPNRFDLQSFFWRQVAQRSAGSPGKSGEYELAWNAVNELVRSDFSWSGYQRNVFFSNNRNAGLPAQEGSFSDSSGVLGLDLEDDSRAFALADFDGDGRLEFALKNRTGPQLRVLHNDLEGIGRSIALRLIGTAGNRDAIGAVVTLESEGKRQVKQLSAGSGFASQHTKELFFGVGNATGPVTLTVRWPNGAATRYEQVPVDRRITLTEGRPSVLAVPFAAKRKPPAVELQPEQPSRSSTRTWLAVPLFGPDLSVEDAAGKTHRLSERRGAPTVLLFLDTGCDDSDRQIAALERESKSLAAAGLGVFAVQVGRGEAPLPKISAALFQATLQQIAAWNIQYRYLFDRRRDLGFPTVFLLDAEGAAVAVYQGFSDPAVWIADSKTPPLQFADRLRKATPYAGLYLGNELVRDYFTYAVAFSEYGLNEAAESALKQAVRQNPNYSAAWFNLGTIYLGQKRYAEAKQALEQAVRLNPNDSDAWNNLGMADGEQNDYSGALTAFRNSALADPNHLVAVENMMQIYQYQQRPGDAQRAMQELVAKAPDNADLHLGLAMSMLGQGDVAGGKAELETAIRLRPDFADALNNLGTVQVQQGDTRAAFDTFERCRQAAPEFDRPVLNEALLYRRSGDKARAAALLKGFLAAHPDNKDVRAALDGLEAR